MAGYWAIRLASAALLTNLALAEPPRRPEIFANVGSFRAGGDEGSLGSSVAYGGALVLPVWPKLAIDIDVQVGSVTNSFGRDTNDLRRWLVSPSLVYRFGSERVYGFAGGGLGWSHDRHRNVAEINPVFAPGPPWRDLGGGLYGFEDTESFRTIHGRAGLVANPVSKLLLRFEFYSIHQFVLPNLGVKAGVGYRF
jgi:hypothetical protein